MACTDMTSFDLRQRHKVGFRAGNLFPELLPVEPSEWLRQSIRMGLESGVSNERARAERLVSPVLLELRERNGQAFSIFSRAHPDTAQNPPGGHSFTCSFSRVQDFITAPVFLVVNTCYRETGEELTPLLQQLIAARRLNELEGHPNQPLYGCSTTGVEWRFLKHEGSDFILGEQRYYLRQLPALLGALQAVVRTAQSGLTEMGVP